MAWPHSGTDWAAILDSVEPVYIKIAQAITQSEQLMLLCRDANHQKTIRDSLQLAGVDLNAINFIITPYNDTWTRDYGPLSVVHDGKACLLDFTFNGWGNKFTADKDNQVTRQLKGQGLWPSTPVKLVDYILEGGSIDTDGQGTVLTTSACLLNKNRNPGASKASVTALLSDYLGCSRLLWLDNGYLAGDDTDSHIDTLARFCSVDSIIYMACDRPDDEHYEALKKMEQELKQLTNRDGQAYQLYPVYLPAPIYDDEQQRLPASYVNFLIINSMVLAPVYGDESADKAAITQLTKAFSEHQIVPIDCKPLIMQHGSLHCVTMQLPEEVK